MNRETNPISIGLLLRLIFIYNWRREYARFFDNPKELISLLDTVLSTHQPTWDDCQQLLQILFTTEKREHTILESWKNLPGTNGPENQADIDEGFPLRRLA